MSSLQSESAQGKNAEDFDLNIVPVIDCFTVLIAYLLVSASFLSLVAFEVNVSVSGEGAVTEDQLKDPPYSLTIRVANDNALDFRLIGGPEGLDEKSKLQASTGMINKAGLRKKLEAFKAQYPKLSDINVSAEGAVLYYEIIRVIEGIKPVYPKVFLAGGHENRVQQ